MKTVLSEEGVSGYETTGAVTAASVADSVISTISFHYVSHIESDLLFRIFYFMSTRREHQIHTAELESILKGENMTASTGNMRNTLSHDSSSGSSFSSAENAQIHRDNAKAIFKHWPQKELGGYGRKLKTLAEAEQLYELLFRRVIVLRRDPPPIGGGVCAAPNLLP